jgi:hypothetical protein
MAGRFTRARAEDRVNTEHARPFIYRCPHSSGPGTVAGLAGQAPSTMFSTYVSPYQQRAEAPGLTAFAAVWLDFPKYRSEVYFAVGATAPCLLGAALLVPVAVVTAGLRALAEPPEPRPVDVGTMR